MKFLRSIYFPNRLYIAILVLCAVFVAGHFLELFYTIGKVSVLLLVALLIVDFFLLYGVHSSAIMVSRKMTDRLSNGDDNQVILELQNSYERTVHVEIIDELPIVFQVREFLLRDRLSSGQKKKFSYHIKPLQRGEFHFGQIHVYVSTVIGLTKRRFSFHEEKSVPVYPSFLQMRKFEIMAISNRLTELGIKKIRKRGNQTEFDQIKDYVKGDDFRTINWKATARRAELMVNQYQDEKAQQVYCLIDMGRTMQMPFEGMSLLDYAINTTLVISNIAILKGDKAGVIGFSEKKGVVVPAYCRRNQMQIILESLYKMQTRFMEPNYEQLYFTVRKQIQQRSLLLLFTNFESLTSMQRRMKYFKQLAAKHLLIVVFFENTEIAELVNHKSRTTEDAYIKTIAEKLLFDRRLMTNEMNSCGIHTILTQPKNLTVSTINKYLEMKAQGMI